MPKIPFKPGDLVVIDPSHFETTDIEAIKHNLIAELPQAPLLVLKKTSTKVHILCGLEILETTAWHLLKHYSPVETNSKISMNSDNSWVGDFLRNFDDKWHKLY